MMLSRLIAVLVLLITAASALVYPFRLPPDTLFRLDQWGARGGWLGALYLSQVRAQVSFSYSPLVYKECVTIACMLALLCTYLVLKVFVRAGGSGGGHPDARARWSAWVRSPVLWIILLLAFTAVGATAGGVLETVLGMAGLSAQERSRIVQSVSAVLGFSPTFHYSLRTFILFAGAIAFFLSVRETASRAFLNQFMILVCFCALIISAVSLMQHLGLATGFMPKWDDPRNRIGSLIGHNTGLSSWLLFPLSFALYLCITATRWGSRLTFSVIAIIIVLVLVAAQSRAIWILGAFMIMVLIPVLLRSTGSGWKRIAKAGALVVMLMLAAILVQTIAPKRNPFANKHMVSLAERVRHDLLNPGQLLRETRLRIAVVSMQLVAKRPLFGYGIGAFQYVYPPAQGRFLLEHPDSGLGYTNKRTDLAHNDYLQFLLENGLVGFILLTVPVVMFLRMGARAYRRATPGTGKAAIAAVGLPMFTVAVHAFLDFPMHTIPIAVLETACLGLWSSTDRILGVQLQSEEPAPVRQPVNGYQGPRLLKVFAAASAVFLVLWSPFGYLFFLREYVSDILFCDGNSWNLTASSLPNDRLQERMQAFGQAKALLREAMHVDIFNDSAFEAQIHNYIGLANDTYASVRKPDPTNDPKLIEAAKLDAERNYSAAINLSTQQIAHGELRYHYTYYLVAEAYLMLSRLHPEIPNYLMSAKRAFNQAVEMNPGDIGSLLELANLCENSPAPDPQMAAKVRDLMFYSDPETWLHTYINRPVMEYADRGDFEAARKNFGRVPQTGAGAWLVKLADADLTLRQTVWPPYPYDCFPTTPARDAWKRQQLDKGEKILAEVEKEHAGEMRVRYLRMLYDAVNGRYREALKLADALDVEFKRDTQRINDSLRVRTLEVAVMRADLAKKVGEKREIWASYELTNEYNRLHHLYRLDYFEDRLGGALQLLARCSKDSGVDVNKALRAAGFFMGNEGHMHQVQRIADYLKAEYPNDPGTKRLFQLIDECKKKGWK